jgi:hypothetical protein
MADSSNDTTLKSGVPELPATPTSKPQASSLKEQIDNLGSLALASTRRLATDEKCLGEVRKLLF